MSHDSAKDEIRKESLGSLEPFADVEFGTVCRNNDHNMEDVVKLSTDHREIRERAKKGWRVYPGRSKYILRAPETTLVDLSDPTSNPSRNPAEVLGFFEFLEDNGVDDILDEAIEDLKVRELKGKTIETEKRIVGESNSIEEVPYQIFEYYKETSDGHESSREPVLRTESIENADPMTFDVYDEIRDFYDVVADTSIPPCMTVGSWTGSPEADVNVFVAKAAIPYFLGFVEETGEKPVLWEYHKGSRDTKEVKMFEEPLRNRKVNIYDKSYSGETLNGLAAEIEDEGGDSSIVATFPKSSQAVDNADYILFGDTFYDTDSIENDDNWHKELYCETFNLEPREI